MSNDADSEALRSMLKELRQATDRSDARYTHIAVDKHFISRLVATGNNVATAYDEGLAETAELEQLRITVDDFQKGRDYSGVDPSFVA